MTHSVHELQTTPLPASPTGDAIGLGQATRLLPDTAQTLQALQQLTHFAWQVGQRLLPWLVPVGLIVAWQIASSLGWLSTRVLPAPLEVITAAWTLTASGELWTHVQVSAARALSGLAVGGGLGLALGLLTGSSRVAETLLDSTIQMVRNIPALALIPLV
ncbi:MAG: ABC transporter permease, partial [Rhodoferax sp.]|nr:ABC transporter permease [Rhodoferax sp.]